MTREQLAKLTEAWSYRERVLADLRTVQRSVARDPHTFVETKFRIGDYIDIGIPVTDVVQIFEKKLKVLDAEIVTLGGTLDAST